MAVAVKPSTVAVWVLDANASNPAIVAVPPTGKSNVGWATSEQPPPQWFNYLFYWSAKWQTYLNDNANWQMSWNESHTFNKGLTSNGGTNLPGGTFAGNGTAPGISCMAGTSGSNGPGAYLEGQSSNPGVICIGGSGGQALLAKYTGANSAITISPISGTSGYAIEISANATAGSGGIKMGATPPAATAATGANVLHASLYPKAWGKVVCTPSGATFAPTLSKGANVATLTDQSVIWCRVNFATPMDSAEYEISWGSWSHLYYPVCVLADANGFVVALYDRSTNLAIDMSTGSSRTFSFTVQALQ